MCVSACGACLRLYTQSAASLSTIICLVIIIIVSSGFSWYEITGLWWAQKSWWPSLEFTDDSLFLQQLSRNSCGRCLRLFFFFFFSVVVDVVVMQSLLVEINQSAPCNANQKLKSYISIFQTVSIFECWKWSHTEIVYKRHPIVCPPSSAACLLPPAGAVMKTYNNALIAHSQT